MGAFQASLVALALCGGGENVLLDFYSDHCPPCRAMQPVIQQLAAGGYSIRKVNVERDRALAQRFGVSGVPCFVMLVGGQEVDRQIGSTSLGRLQQMLAKAAPAQPSGQTPNGWVAGGPEPSASIPIPPVQTDRTFASTGPAGPDPQPPPRSTPTSDNAASTAEWGERLDSQLTASTVRLRIDDAVGRSCGSGTIVDTQNGKALILTCGHLFRDSQGRGRIAVDLFGATPVEAIPGRLVHYDLKTDLGLVSIPVRDPVCVTRIAPPGYQIAKGARVVSVGCNNGNPPTPRHGQVTSLDKFDGPSNIEASGLPVQGRSGGGLFSSDGFLIGVCNAAVPTDNEGLYAGLAAIHAELNQSDLISICRSDRVPRGTEVAAATAEPLSMPKHMPPPADVPLTETSRESTLPQALDSQRAGPRGPRTEENAAVTPASLSEPVAPAAGLRPEEKAALEEIHRKTAEGAELICIIRSRANSQARSEIIVVDKASAEFLQQATGSRGVGSTSREAHPGGEDRADSNSSRGYITPNSPAGEARPPLRETSSLERPNEAPESDWRPRWLQPGYQGS